jgi:hypothetical protein
VLVKAVTFPCVWSVDVGEALGLRNVLQWLSDMQFDIIDFKIDS